MRKSPNKALILLKSPDIHLFLDIVMQCFQTMYLNFACADKLVDISALPEDIKGAGSKQHLYLSKILFVHE